MPLSLTLYFTLYLVTVILIVTPKYWYTWLGSCILRWSTPWPATATVLKCKDPSSFLAFPASDSFALSQTFHYYLRCFPFSFAVCSVLSFSLSGDASTSIFPTRCSVSCTYRRSHSYQKKYTLNSPYIFSSHFLQSYCYAEYFLPAKFTK